MPEFFFDSVNGLNTNPGNLNAPLCGLQGFMALLRAGKITPGSIIRWEETCHFEFPEYARMGSGAEPQTYLKGTAENPILFSSYRRDGGPSQRKPTFQVIYTAVDADWKWDASLALWYWDHPAAYGSNLLQWGSYPLVLIDDEMCLVTLAAGPTFQRGQTPAGPKQAASWWITNGIPGRLYVWTPNASSNPNTNPTRVYGAGKVKAASNLYGVFQFNRCGNYVTVENLHAVDSAPIGNIYNDNSGTEDLANFVLRNCETTRTAGSFFMQFPNNGVFTGGSILVDGAIFREQTGPAIQGASKGFTIRNFQILGANYARNDPGGIYINGPLTGMYGVIEDGYFWDCRYESAMTPGAAWLHGNMAADGSGCYLEAYSNNITVRRCVFDMCYLPMQDNSGGKNNWLSNLTINCDRMIKISDQSNLAAINGGSIINFHHNTAINPTFNRLMNKSMRDVIQAMKGTPTPSNYTWNFANNLFYATNAVAATEGWIWGIENGVTFWAANNAAYGFMGIKGDIGSHGNATVPPQTLLFNPLVNADGTLKYNSPARGHGLAGYAATDLLSRYYGSVPAAGCMEFSPFGAASRML